MPEVTVAAPLACPASPIACTVRSCTSTRYDVGTPPQTPAVFGPPCEWSESTTICDAVGTGAGVAPFGSATALVVDGHESDVVPVASDAMQSAASLRISFSPNGP